jgi:putative DNA primase/helicase
MRLIHDSDRTATARKLHGTLDELWPVIEAAQAEGYGAFVVVNEGGDNDAEINVIRAAFVDADNVLFEGIQWHIRPDFIVQRDHMHWHAYWRVYGLSVEEFRSVQQRLAAYYGTDSAVCNPSRVMRLAGTLHQKVAA